MITYSPKQIKEIKKTLRKSRPKRIKKDTEIMQSSMFDPDGYLYPKYAIAKTTWAYCWRCGEKIAINHTEEIRTGIHKECQTMYDVQERLYNQSALNVVLLYDLR